MSYHRALERIYDVLEADYHTPTEHLAPAPAAALAQVAADLRDGVDAHRIRQRLHELHDEGVLDRVHLYSALGVVAASPQVRDHAEALRLASMQELAAWEDGGPDRQAHLASVERHRGVVAFLMHRYSVALECFTRALERERTAENLGNVLATLLRLGDRDGAHELLATIRGSFPAHIREALERRIRADRDLVALRS